MSESTPLGVVILSAVRHATSYLPLFQGMPDVVVRAICEEADTPSWAYNDAEALGQQFSIPVTTDVASTLARSDVDLVLVCSEPTRHARLSTQVLASGKHVLVDKPFATTLADARLLRDAAEQSPARLTMIHRLLAPQTQRARTAIDAGHIGLPLSLDLEWLASDGLRGEAVERADLVADPALSGGGEMMNFLTYPISAIRYLTGAAITSVYAEAGTFFFDPHRHHGTEDLGMLSLELDHGIVATITVGRVPQAPSASPVSSTMRVIGSHGHLTVNESQPSLDVWRPRERSAQTIGGDAGKRATLAVIEHFVDDIRVGREPLFTAHDGWATMAVIDAAYRSLEMSQPVMV